MSYPSLVSYYKILLVCCAMSKTGSAREISQSLVNYNLFQLSGSVVSLRVPLWVCYCSLCEQQEQLLTDTKSILPALQIKPKYAGCFTHI